jgi:hypothetical protein
LTLVVRCNKRSKALFCKIELVQQIVHPNSMREMSAEQCLNVTKIVKKNPGMGPLRMGVQNLYMS